MKKQTDPTRTPVTRQHKARILCLDGQRCRIDRDIAPLVEGIFALGIRTFSSCQSSCGGWCDLKHPATHRERYWNTVSRRMETHWARRMPKRCHDSVWLVFNTAGDASKFLRVVSRPTDPEDLRDKMVGEGSAQMAHCWVWKTRCHRDDDTFTFFTVLVFPRAHLQLVTERVQEAVAKKGRHSAP